MKDEQQWSYGELWRAYQAQKKALREQQVRNLYLTQRNELLEARLSREAQTRKEQR